MKVRLNKFIADCGICSRRKADELINEGSVSVNGQNVFELGIKIDPSQDVVKVSGKKINASEDFVYFILNKPINVLTSMGDPTGRPTVADYFEGYKKHRVFPVGRLDWASEGMLLFTNDGEYANKVTHPKEGIPKTYNVKINQPLTKAKVDKLKRGVSIEGGGRVKAEHLYTIKKSGSETTNNWVSITITEGKNRQVRKMFEKVGIDVLRLRRISIGALKIGSLGKGEVRQLPPDMAMKVFKVVKVPKQIMTKIKDDKKVSPYSKKSKPIKKKASAKKRSSQKKTFSNKKSR